MRTLLTGWRLRLLIVTAALALLALGPIGQVTPTAHAAARAVTTPASHGIQTLTISRGTLAPTATVAHASASATAGIRAPLTPEPDPISGTDNCVFLETAILASQPNAALYTGTAINECQFPVTGLLTIKPSELCMGITAYSPLIQANVTGLAANDSTSWSGAIVWTCSACDTTTHKIVSAPPFYVKGQAIFSGNESNGVPVSSMGAVVGPVRLNNSGLGEPC